MPRTVTKVIDLCDRDAFGKERPATTKREFSVDGAFYELKLCEPHAEMFDREIGGWTRLAAEIDAPPARQKSAFFTAERRREAQRITELRQAAADKAASREFAERRAGEIAREMEIREESEARASIPGAAKWRLTDHARERRAQRDFSFAEVYGAAAFPEFVHSQPWRGPHIAVHQRGDCRVAVNENTHAIITVIDRGDVLESEPTDMPITAQKAKAH